MTSEEFIKRWKDVILLMFTTLGFIYATFAFIRDRVHVRDDLQATAIGDVDTRQTPENQDRISLRLAVVNAGTRDAAVLQAEIVALRKESDGYSWVRIFLPLGEGFEAKVLKPGEITIVSLVTDGRVARPLILNFGCPICHAVGQVGLLTCAALQGTAHAI